MKRTYKDLTDDQLAALHRAALGLPVEVIVTVYRENQNVGVHPFVSTHHSEDEAVLFWWVHDNTLSTDAGMQDINYLAAADLARQLGIGYEVLPEISQSDQAVNPYKKTSECQP